MLKFNCFCARLVVSLLASVWTSYGKTNSITIGGFFDVFDYDHDGVSEVRAEHLDAFLLAVDEINAQSTLLPDHDIKIAIRNADGTTTAASAIADFLNISDLGGVVSTLLTEDALFATSLCSESNVVTVNSVASATELGVAKDYTHNIQIRPIDSFVGMVTQSIVCDLNISRIAMFVDDDLFGRMISAEIMENTFCQLQNIAKYTFKPWEQNFDSAIVDATASDATVFMIFLKQPERIAQLLEDGYHQGLFTLGTQIFLLREDILDYFHATDDIADILHGSIVVKYDPEFIAYNTSIGHKYITNYNHASVVPCNATDSTGYEYLKNATGGCSNLTTSIFLNGIHNHSSVGAYTYDAVYTLAWGLHHAYAHDNTVLTAGSINGTAIKHAIIDKVAFIGASGFVDIYEGMAERSYYAQGCREVGNFYKFLNFQVDHYLRGEYPFIPVSMWSAEQGIFDCPTEMQCDSFVFNTYDGAVPNSYPPFAFDHAPEIIKIGGMFAPFGPNGVLDVQQAEHLAAFLLAIEHINNKTDGIHDDLLPNSHVVYSVVNNAYSNNDATAGVSYLFNSFYGSRVIGAVCGLPSGPAAAADVISAGRGIFTAFSEANETDFGDAEKHPYRASTTVLDSFTGMVIQNLLCFHFKMRKISVFHTSTAYGGKTLADLFSGEYCDLEELSDHQFLSRDHNFASEMKKAAAAGARAFVLLSMPLDTGALLEQGYNSGLFGKDTVVIIAESDGLFDQVDGRWVHFSPDADVPAIMKGVFSVKYFPDFELKNSPQGIRFVQDFINQKTLSTPGDCFHQLDDNHERQMFRAEGSSACAELNYSEYRSGIRTIAPWTANTYDATHLLLQGIGDALAHHTSTTSSVDATEIRNALAAVSMVGATGQLQVFQGHADADHIDRGNREVGVYFRVLNFNSATHAADNKTGFATVDVLSIDNGVLVTCPAFVGCVAPVYQTSNNQVPAESKPDIHIKMSVMFVAVLVFLGALTVGFCCFVVYMIYAFTNTRHIKNAQGSLMYFVSVGGIIGGLRTIMAALPVTDWKCSVELWLGHIAFGLIFGGMFVKSYRLSLIFKTAFKKVTITTEICLKYMAKGLSALLVCLAIITAVGVPTVAHQRTTSGNQTTISPYCSSKIPAIETALYVLEFFFLCYGFKLCYIIKDIPAKYNEAEANLNSIIIVCVVATLSFAQLYVVNLDPLVAQSVVSVLMGVAVLAMVLLLFVGKVIRIYKLGPKKVHVRRNKGSIGMAEDGGAIMYPYSVATDDEKFEWVNIQIRNYQSTILNIGRDESSQTSRENSRLSQQSEEDEVSHVHTGKSEGKTEVVADKSETQVHVDPSPPPVVSTSPARGRGTAYVALAGSSGADEDNEMDLLEKAEAGKVQQFNNHSPITPCSPVIPHSAVLIPNKEDEVEEFEDIKSTKTAW